MEDYVFPEAENESFFERLSIDEFKKSFGEDFTRTIDISTWDIGANIGQVYAEIERELFNAKRHELEANKVIREEIYPTLRSSKFPYAGLYNQVNLELIEKIHRGFLFNGAVTACAGVNAIYNSLPLSITQIGVCLVNYQGEHGSYSHKLFKRDFRFTTDDTVTEAMDFIAKRRMDERAQLSMLALRGIRTFAERAILLERSGAKWLMGNGSPAPLELMTGFWGSYPEMKDRAIALMEKMIVEHERFIYVQGSTRDPDVWALGNALNPFEYLVLGTLEDRLTEMVQRGGTRGKIREAYLNFANDIGKKIVYGVFRISRFAPPQIFYCHVNHVEVAPLIALSDSALQIHLGAPMLLDLAESLCRSSFGKTDFIISIDQAYARAEIQSKMNPYGND